MAAMLIYGKQFKIFFSRTKKALRLSLGIQHWRRKVYQARSNDGPRMAFLWHCQFFLQVAVAILEEWCMASADMRRLFHSFERIMVPVFFCFFFFFVFCFLFFVVFFFLFFVVVFLYYYYFFCQITG